jgi:hypothetical protein
LAVVVPTGRLAVVMWTASGSVAALPLAGDPVVPHPSMQMMAVKASMLENKCAVEKKQIFPVMKPLGPIAFSGDTISQLFKKERTQSRVPSARRLLFARARKVQVAETVIYPTKMSRLLVKSVLSPKNAGLRNYV